MKKTYVIDRTGEVITANVEGDYEVSEKDAKIIERKRRERKLRMFSNSEKKRFLIRRKLI